MKKFIRALLLGIVLVVGYYGFHIVQGMILTMTYTPDLLEAYDSHDYVQHKVSFGVSPTSPMRTAMEISGLMVVGMVLTYTWDRLKRKKKGN
ncbi:hypothetical protein ACFO9Q_19305 [Paenibacillus sp. GCM10023252]|uniref:hypothetical protein n=1 Tax=Paenibacillus sp. GCM10023252 TaxID=3252649 RepID=UPI003615B881